MSEVAIFLFGLVVFAIVATACGLIGWGIITEQRDRMRTDAEADAAGAHEVSTATLTTGKTAATGPLPRGSVR